MKFQNGQWLPKEGHCLFSPTRIMEIEKDETGITLVMPTTKVMDGVTLTMRVTTPMPEMIRVQVYHYMGTNDENDPSFDLNLPETLPPIQAEETDDTLTIYSGHLSMVIDKKTCYARYKRDKKPITSYRNTDLSYVKTDWRGEYYTYDSEGAYMCQQLGLSVGELIYGLGERFTPFVRNGQAVDVWNEDGGTSSEQSYKNIPFYVSNKGYGIFVNQTENVSFEIGSAAVAKTQFSVAGESLDYFVINGPTMKDVLMRYTDLAGKPGLPADWTFGLWLSTSFVTRYDEETVMGFIDGMAERGIPLKVFHFDFPWPNC